MPRKTRLESYLGGLRDKSKVLRYCRRFADEGGNDLVYFYILGHLRPSRSSAFDADHVVCLLKMFLLDWNFVFYLPASRREDLEEDLEEFWLSNRREILALRRFDIRRVKMESHKESIETLFADAEEYGSIRMVGASKVLHLLCPSLLSPWDTSIKAAFHRGHPGFHTPRTCQSHAECYYSFIRQSHDVLSQLPCGEVISKHPHKRIAEKFRSRIYPTKIFDECNWMYWYKRKG